ncbi:GNAT family N-acetyltransferase [Longimicrobium terrae]|uniref:GNAT superfamily N-acetyltransferase n=1 Tax=Longimicrobium terrae TaxID=1639882 RepID=A0A841GNL9_9BACT|nr:GNAT family N-acetyltransferase [Longimicrobium terrae]MBB4634198.1 GNAT superfamily N-acetyltransferase [Longimicrobium terrae]MBB6068912.1 GNAT superfamily N-acetyltransferase [Longimicrobium terrae]NNC28092.1 GNAT family N-acetyltransferase [Longimicrobium terrae]
MHDQPIIIRPAAQLDAPAISALIIALSRYFLADPDRPGDAAVFLETITPAGVANTLADGRFRYHVADADGVLVGVVGVRDGRHLYHLFVAEPFHGRGIAARLWAHARRVALQDGDHPGEFTVNSSLHAVPVYERLGFAPDGERTVKDGIAYLPMRLARAGSHPSGPG